MMASGYKSPRKRLIAVAGIIAVLGIVYFAVDPSAVRFMPRCLFNEMTGWLCPGCGSQRMLHALLHADWAAAWGYNALLLILLPFIFPLLYLELNASRHPHIYMKLHSVPVIITITLIIIGWGVMRNLL